MPTLFVKNLASAGGSPVIISDPTGYDQTATVITAAANATTITLLTQDTFANMQGGLDALVAAGNIEYWTSEGSAFVARYVATSAINLATNGLTPVDTGAIVAGDIVLVTDQASGPANGLYVASAGTWTRLVGPNGESSVSAGESVFVTEGTTYASTSWVLTTKNPIVVGTTSLTYTQTATSASAAGTTYNDATFVHSVGTPTNVQTGLDALKHYIPLTLADPGTGVAIGVTRSANVALTIGSAGPETNTLAIPTFIGQRVIISANTVGSGTRTITVAAAFNTTGNDKIDFTAAGQSVVLEAVTVAAGLVWVLVVNNGTTLST